MMNAQTALVATTRPLQSNEDVRFLRLEEVMRKTGLSRATIWREEKAGRFPIRVKLTKHAIGWSSQAINRWMAARIHRCR